MLDTVHTTQSGAIWLATPHWITPIVEQRCSRSCWKPLRVKKGSSYSYLLPRPKTARSDSQDQARCAVMLSTSTKQSSFLLAVPLLADLHRALAESFSIRFPPDAKPALEFTVIWTGFPTCGALRAKQSKEGAHFLAWSMLVWQAKGIDCRLCLFFDTCGFRCALFGSVSKVLQLPFPLPAAIGSSQMNQLGKPS